MIKQWTLSPGLHDLISKKLNESGPAGLGTDFYPSILWSLGGEIRQGTSIEKIAPHYALGWIKTSDMSRFESLNHREFGCVAFQPSRTDEKIRNGIIDIDDRGIYVRSSDA